MSGYEFNAIFGVFWLFSGIITAMIIIAMQYHIDQKITVGDCVAATAFGVFGFVTIFYVIIKLATHFRIMDIVIFKKGDRS